MFVVGAVGTAVVVAAAGLELMNVRIAWLSVHLVYKITIQSQVSSFIKHAINVISQ